MINWREIVHHIELATQTELTFANAVPVAGGDINQSWHIEVSRNQEEQATTQHYFIKLNTSDRISMFAAEQAGLSAIAATHTIQAPQAITHGICGQHSFLVMEYMPLSSAGDASALGTQLAALHRCEAAQFGWHIDNTIGATPQHNSRSDDWISFWREQRLGFQLQLAAHNGHRGKMQTLGASLLDALPEFFIDYHPAPSLLHGDLWSGNYAFLRNGTPLIFDPATYYGDRETDIAMTELFGGFPAAFYTAYRAAYPLDNGYSRRRKPLYNLYHILNHANLFGGGYAQQAERMMQQLLGQV